MRHPNTPRTHYWLIPLQWVAHFLDEALFGFPEWATRHFAPLPTALWYPGMIVLTALLLALALLAARSAGAAAFPFVATAFQSIFAWNTCFHVATTIMFGEYSPGAASGVLLMLPLSFAFYRSTKRDPRMAGRRVVVAIATGFLVHALVVCSLFVDKTL